MAERSEGGSVAAIAVARPRLQTVESLVDEATLAATPAEAEKLLLAAAAQAAGFREWERILDALSLIAGAEATRRALVARAREAASKHREVWGFRAVARAEVSALGDLRAARETVRAGEAMLRAETEIGGFEWGVLAEAAKLAVGDEEAVRYLEEGWRIAWGGRNVENLGRLAGCWWRLVSRDAAAAKLAEAERAAIEWGRQGGVIYWWHALGDAAAGVRVRSEVLARSTVFEEVRDLVRYWELYDEASPGREAALGRLEALAGTAQQCLELAQEASRHDDTAVIRRALDRAATMDAPRATKVRVAAGYRAWLDDAEAAARVGPSLLRPEETREAREAGATTLEGWHGSASALFDALRARVTPTMLRTIALADYGQDVEKHEAALSEICRTGSVPPRLVWHPCEVVELTRWGEGDDVDHVARALCCTILCLAGDFETLRDGPILVDSCLVLGDGMVERAKELFVWHWETTEYEGDQLGALLALAVLVGAEGDPKRAGEVVAKMREREDFDGLRQGVAESMRAKLWAKLLARSGVGKAVL